MGDVEAAYQNQRYDEALRLLPDSLTVADVRCTILLRLQRTNDAINLALMVWKDSEVTHEIKFNIADRFAYELNPKLAQRTLAQYTALLDKPDPADRALVILVEGRLGNVSALTNAAKVFNNNRWDSPLLAQQIYEEFVLGNYRRGNYRDAMLGFDYVYMASPSSKLNPNYMIEWAVISNNVGDALKSLAKLNELNHLMGDKLTLNQKAWISDLEGEAYMQIADYENALIEFSNVLRMADAHTEAAQNFAPTVSNQITFAQRRKLLGEIGNAPTSPTDNTSKRVIFVSLLIVSSLALIIYTIKHSVKQKHPPSIIIFLLIIELVGPCLHGEQFEIKHDFGDVLSQTNLLFVTQIPVSSSTKVRKITTSCGCTTSNIRVGDILTKTNEITVRVVAELETGFGAVRREVNIDTDKAVYKIILNYNWLPDPYSRPLAAVFSKAGAVQKLVIYFPRDQEVKYVKVTSLDTSLRVKGVQNMNNSIALEFVLTSRPNEDRDGFINVYTDSTNCPLYRVPCLLLK